VFIRTLEQIGLFAFLEVQHDNMGCDPHRLRWSANRSHEALESGASRPVITSWLKYARRHYEATRNGRSRRAPVAGSKGKTRSIRAGNEFCLPRRTR
jgi:hypothetical protein